MLAESSEQNSGEESCHVAWMVHLLVARIVVISSFPTQLRLRHFTEALGRIGSCPRTGRAMGPGPTRMVVYSAAFLQQSFFQHQVRCAALQDAIAALSERPGKDNGAKQDVCKVLLTVFLDPAPYLLAWMTAGMFLRTKGYVTGDERIERE